MYKVGDLVSFSFFKTATQDNIQGMGVFAEAGTNGEHKVLFQGKAYWLPYNLIQPVSMIRKPDVNDEPLN